MYFSKDFYRRLHLLLLLVLLFAATILLQACSLKEDPTSTLLRKARDCEYSGQFAEAENTYQKISLTEANKSLQLSVLINQARFYLRTKNYNQAIAVCQKGLTICTSTYGPKDMLNTSFLFALACAYDGLKEYDKASSIYKNIMTFAPASPAGHNMVRTLPLIKLGDIQFRKNNSLQALKLYKEAYRLVGESSWASPWDMISRIISYRLALCCIALKRYSEAEFYFKNSLPHFGINAAPKDIYHKYAAFLAKTGKFASAGLAETESKEWQANHKEYEDWQWARTLPSSRFRLLDLYSEQDYDLVDKINEAREINNRETNNSESK